MQIKIKYHPGATKIIQHGNWIDLFPRKEYFLKAPSIRLDLESEGQVITFNSELIDLGISMKLPKYFEAHIVPRGSTFVKQGLIQGNHIGIIDTEYSGESDIWMFPAIALRNAYLTPKKAICQFKIQISMDAPWYVKLRWLFTNKIKFEEVDVLTDISRGGFGHTDK